MGVSSILDLLLLLAGVTTADDPDPGDPGRDIRPIGG